MSVYRQRRFQILALLTLLSALVVWAPSEGMSLSVGGLSLESDVVGGTQAIIQMESSIVTLAVPGDDMNTVWEAVWIALRENYLTTLISTDEENNTLTFEISGAANTSFLNSLIGNYGENIEVKAGPTQATRDKTIASLRKRLDPYGLLGVKLRIIEENKILVEGSEDTSSSLRYLSSEGRLEFAVDDSIASAASEVLAIASAAESQLENYGQIVVYFNENGGERFKNALAGRPQSRIVYYLDRPFDAIIVFDENVLIDLSAFYYDENSLVFRENLRNYPLHVPVLKSPSSELDPSAKNYLEQHAGEKYRVILMGRQEDYADNFIAEIPSSYALEFHGRRKQEAGDDWIVRVTGVITSLPVEPQMAETGLTENAIVVPVPGGRQSAVDLRTALVNRAPTRVSLIDQATVEPRFSQSFGRLAIISTLVGILAVSFLTFYWHKRFEVSIAMAVMLFCVLIVVLALVSAMRLTVGLTEIVGVLTAVNIGAAQMLIITNEIVGGQQIEKGASISWKVPKALNLDKLISIIILLSLLTILSFNPIPIWSFILIITTGVFIASFLINPVYAKLLSSIYG